MKWRTGERTLKVYEHLRRDFRFSEQLAGIHRTMQGRERTFATRQGKPASGEPPTRQETAGTSPELAYLLGEDEGD
jgi:hypothetical protein